MNLSIKFQLTSFSKKKKKKFQLTKLCNLNYQYEQPQNNKSPNHKAR